MPLRNDPSLYEATVCSVAIVLLALLAGCASLGSTIVDSGLTPTSGIRSATTEKSGAFIPVGLTPAAPGPDLSPTDRQKVEADLIAARDHVRTLAAIPTDKPLPKPASAPVAPNPALRTP